MGEPTVSDVWHPERYRDYLLMLARLRFPDILRGKLSASDVVQETLLKAEKAKGQFRGDGDVLAAYLRKILANTMADKVREFTRDKQNVALERSLHEELEQSSDHLEKWLAADQSSPSEQAERNEMLLRLAGALAKLPEDERTALELRYLREIPVSAAEIAAYLNRDTPRAATGLLARGLARLRKLLNAQGDGHD